jgi:hypothetical protein
VDILVVYTTVVYALVNSQRSLPIGSGLILISPLYPQSPATLARAADVLVMLTIKPDIERERVMKVMPDEIRATVRLYLDGKIRQSYSRADGKGVVFVLDCKDVDEARSVMEALHLARGQFVNLEFTALTPLTPLRLLLDGRPQRP